MGKIKTLALASIMLSSTVLGTSPLIVQAKANAAPSITATKALTQSTTSTAVAAKGTATTFADLKNNTTMKVAPIFGKSGSDFNTDLANELNITTSKTDTTQIPMTVVESNKFGFATKVTFTSGDTTKTVNVQYDYAKPTVSFSNSSQVMNFTTKTAPAQTDFYKDVVNKDVTAASDNKTDAKGVENAPTLLTDMSTSDITDPGTYTVAYTPKDNYTTGDTVNRTINVFGEPDWTQLDGRKVAIGDTTAIDTPYIISNAQGQKFSVAITTGKDTLTSQTDAATDNAVTYTATPIDANGNVVNDSSTGKPMATSTEEATIATVDTTETPKAIPYTISFKNADGNIVGTTTGDFDSTADTKTITIDAPEGYALKNASDATYTVDTTDLTKTPISKSVDVVPAELSYTVNYVDKDSGKTIDTTNATGTYGSYISLKAPKDYELANVVDRGFTLKTDKYVRTVYVTKSNVPYVITFLDQDTGRTIGITTGEGADGEDVTLTAPDGYSFINADDIQMTINKDNPNKSIEVAPNSSDFLGTITTYPNSGYTDLYSSKGTLLDDVVLSDNSSWITDKKVYINGVKFFRVATNEYVKASDAYLYTPMSKIAQTNGKTVTKVYDSKGNLLDDRALATNSAWKVDKAARINGNKMYRVATNEWVNAKDVTIL